VVDGSEVEHRRRFRVEEAAVAVKVGHSQAAKVGERSLLAVHSQPVAAAGSHRQPVHSPTAVEGCKSTTNAAVQREPTDTSNSDPFYYVDKRPPVVEKPA
jgi:hypothetical protein